MARAWLGMLGIVGALALNVACSFIYCVDGILPYDGQSNVPLDAHVEIRISGRLDETWSALRDGVEFHDITDGDPVPVEFDLVRNGEVVMLIPTSGLEPDHTYSAYGLNRNLLAGRHGHGDWFLGGGASPASSTFTTAPGLRGVAWQDQTGTRDAVEVLFSQPVPRSRQSQVRLWRSAEATTPFDVEFDRVSSDRRRVQWAFGGEPSEELWLSIEDEDGVEGERWLLRRAGPELVTLANGRSECD